MWLRLAGNSLSSPSWVVVGVSPPPPRGCVQSHWSCDRPETCPQGNKEPNFSVNLSQGSVRTLWKDTPPLPVGGNAIQASQHQGLSLPLFPAWTDLSPPT